ncbi:MAG: protein-L-isoaspartate O-methyltransferase [Candidatus Buchananbacteria bacterium]
MENLINKLISDGHLKTPAVINAFQRVKRRDFLPKKILDKESENQPLPIGHGATISQPLTVAFMLELLAPKPGQNILDVGSGSGWTSALLAYMVGPKGKVWAIERVVKLKEFGEKNAEKYHFDNLKFYCRDGSKGLPKSAPFDRILVSAAAFEVPMALKNQLKIGGRLVIPTSAQDIRVFEKVTVNKFKEKIYPGFIFVPLVGNY